MQNVFGIRIKDCESVVHCTQSVHTDVFAGGDEFAAAFVSRVALFELYDSMRPLFSVPIRDEESISEPQECPGLTQLDFRKFFQLVVAQSMHEHQPFKVAHRHRHTRVAAARRGEPLILFGHLDVREGGNARAALHTEQLHPFGSPLADKYSRVTQRATDLSHFVGLQALRLAPLAAVAAQCHQPVGSLPVLPVFA